MKASEFAALLLQTPDLDVCTPNGKAPNAVRAFVYDDPEYGLMILEEGYEEKLERDMLAAVNMNIPEKFAEFQRQKAEATPQMRAFAKMAGVPECDTIEDFTKMVYEDIAHARSIQDAIRATKREVIAVQQDEPEMDDDAQVALTDKGESLGAQLMAALGLEDTDPEEEARNVH